MIRGFNKQALNIIEKFSYDFYIVQPNPDIKCTCINENTLQADPNCEKCLGTGQRIKIKKVRGASQDSDSPATMRAGVQVIVARNYYIPLSEAEMHNDDIIVDGKYIYFVFQNLTNRSFQGEAIFQKSLTITKKLNTKVFLKNFNKIIGR